MDLKKSLKGLKRSKKSSKKDYPKVKTSGKEKMESFLKALGNAAPYRQRMSKLLVYSGREDIPAMKFIGKLIFTSLILGIGVLLISILYFPPLYAITGFLITFFGLQFLVFIFYNLQADGRSRKVEQVLPDALQLISANIRAGMTLNRAIWLSARPEFGPLESEIRRIGAETIGGKSMEHALSEVPKRIDSKILDRAIKLIIEGMKSGGEMANLLDETAEDIRVSYTLRQEIQSSVMMYSMFIVFASVLGAPSLFAISIFFVETTSSLWSATSVEEYSQLQSGFLTPSTPTITSDDLFLFSLAMIIISTLFGALLIGLIQSGKAQRGIKFILPLAGTGIVVFLIARVVVSSLLGGLISF